MEPAWIAGGAAVVSSFAAIWAATNGNRTLKRSDRDSTARTRPMVAAELQLRPYVTRTQFLVIKNYGLTIARNVMVTFDPPLGDPAPERLAQSTAPFLKDRYAKPIPTFVPGMELDNIYYQATGTDGTNREPFPDQVGVIIDFDGPDGTHYTDRFDLDVMVLRNRTYVNSSDHPDRLLKDAVKHLAVIKDALEHIARSMPEDLPPNERAGQR